MCFDSAHLHVLPSGRFFDSLRSFVLVLALDLSTPSRIWATAEAVIARVRERIQFLLEQVEPYRPDLRAALRSAAANRMPPNHPVRNQPALTALDPLMCISDFRCSDADV